MLTREEQEEGEQAPGFRDHFGRAPDVTASAPGRVNLIGEHTDYNGGFVLPTATPQRTFIELARRDDGEVRAFSADVRGKRGKRGDLATYRLGEEARRRGWIDYIQGVTAALRESGVALSGFDARITSDVPLGSGLSSSAALEIALLRALDAALGLGLDPVQMALLGQRAENDLVGASVGVMDQMAASLADTEHALFLDTRSLTYEMVPLPAEAELIVVNSGITHSHAGGEYRTRRAECEEAAARLGVPALRDVPASDLGRVEALPEPLRRRAKHVVTENERVLGAMQALRSGDLVLLGTLFQESHASMRDDFEVSIPEIDALVDIACQEPDVYGARLTGGGFGGSVVMLAKKGAAREAAQRITRAYSAQTGRTPAVLVPEDPTLTPVGSSQGAAHAHSGRPAAGHET